MGSQPSKAESAGRNGTLQGSKAKTPKVRRQTLAAADAVHNSSPARGQAGGLATGVYGLVSRSPMANAGRDDSGSESAGYPTLAATGERAGLVTAGSEKRSAGLVMPLVQRRLLVGAANDALEMEADRVARTVLQTPIAPPPPVPSSSAEPQAQRAEKSRRVPGMARGMLSAMRTDIQRLGEGSFEPSGEFQRRLLQRKGTGKPLSDGVRSEFGTRLGADFAGVRVHTGPNSTMLNRMIQAKAFTHGRDIYFGDGQYSPGSANGKFLLAHELTHTIQQGVAPVQRVVDPAIATAGSPMRAGVGEHIVRRVPVGIQRYLEDVDKSDVRAVGNRAKQLILEWKSQPFLSRPSAGTIRHRAREMVREVGGENCPEGRAVLNAYQFVYQKPLKMKAVVEPVSKGGGDEYEKEERAMTLAGFQEELEGIRTLMKSGELPRDFEDRIDEISRFAGVPNPLTTEKELDINGSVVAPIQVTMPGERTVSGFSGRTAQGKVSIDKVLLPGLTAHASSDSMVEMGVRGKGSAKTSSTKTKKSGEFDLSGFAGIALRNKSEAEIQHHLLGAVKGDILTLLKLGAEGHLSGSAEAALTGLKAQLLADAFLGAKLDVVANAEFGNDLVALQFGGEIHGTAGVEANLGLSAALGKSGFEAALKAGFFAGAKISFVGSASLNVGKRNWGNISGSASFSAGAGGEVDAGIKLNGSGFTVRFGASATVGVGAGATTAFKVDLKNIGLSAKEAKTNLMNFHTTKILGYENLDIQMADRLKALEDVLWEVNQQVGAAEKRRAKIEKGSDKVSLL